MRAALGASLALGLLSGSAMAADLGPYRPPGSIKDIPPPDFIPAFSWTGVYFGAQGGYGWGDSSFEEVEVSTFTWQHEGAFGGGYAGFNWQLNSLVLGVEGDVNAADIEGSTAVAEGAVVRSSIDSFASIRARAGLAADRWLFFVTGGWAWADVTDTLNVEGVDTFTADETVNMWTVGGGIEYAFTDRLVGRVEYRHYDFDSKFLEASTDTDGRFETDLDTVSAGLAVKF